MYAPRGSAAARRLEGRVIRATVLMLVLFGAILVLPRSVSRQSEPESARSSADAPPAASGASGLSVVRDANAEPVVARPVPSRSSGAPVVTPRPGTAPRRALLAAMRREAGVRNLFRVDQMTVSGRFAFVRVEALRRSGDDLRPTGREFAALLERADTTAARWHALEFWARATEGDRPYAEFDRRVRVIARQRALPPSLLPARR